MGVNLYHLNEKQITLAYVVLDKGRLTKNGKMMAVRSDVFNKREDGKALIRLGKASDLLRRVKPDIYVMQAKRVQQIVSIHERPVVSRPREKRPQVTEKEDLESISKAFADLNETNDVHTAPPSSKGKQPVTAYLGVAISVAGLLISTFISKVGLTGLFTVFLGTIGFLLTAFGTFQFFRYAGKGTDMSSKRIHIILTVASLLTLVSLVYGTIISPPRVAQGESEDQGSSIELAEQNDSEGQTVVASTPSVQEAIRIDMGSFSADETDEGWIDTKLPVVIENTSETPYLINVTIQATNMNGNTVGQPDYLFMVDVEPGESREFNVFEHVNQEAASTLSQEGVEFTVVDLTAVNTG